MKKILFLIGIIALFAIGVQAQDNVSVSARGSNIDFKLDAGDTLSNNSTTLSKVIDLRSKQEIQLYSLQVTLDSISGTPTESIILAGSLDGTNYTGIDTVSWTGTDADTTFFFTDITTGVAWPFLRVQSTESGTAKAQLTELTGRVLNK